MLAHLKRLILHLVAKVECHVLLIEIFVMTNSVIINILRRHSHFLKNIHSEAITSIISFSSLSFYLCLFLKTVEKQELASKFSDDVRLINGLSFTETE